MGRDGQPRSGGTRPVDDSGACALPAPSSDAFDVFEALSLVLGWLSFLVGCRKPESAQTPVFEPKTWVWARSGVFV